MSELLGIDEPEPLPGSAVMERNPLDMKLERLAILDLCRTADEIIEAQAGVRQRDENAKVTRDNVLLRRVIHAQQTDSDRTKITSNYFFVEYDEIGEYGYCRSWSSYSDQVNWCLKEDRHEPARDVATRLETAFPAPSPEIPARRFGAQVLAKLRRR